MERISDNVYVQWDARGCCSHSFVTTGEGVVMIDTPVVPAAAARWAREIERHGQLRYIINTEPHIDHFGGNSFFPGIVVAHDEARDRIASTPVEEMIRMLAAGAPESLPIPETFGFRSPEITFSERLTLHLGHHTFQLLTMPGHTSCQTVVYVPEEKVLFSGDTISNRTMPSLYEAVPLEWIGSLEKLDRFDIAFVVPGHGAVGGRELIDEMAGALRAAIGAVKAAIDDGMTVKQAKDCIMLFDGYADFLPGEDFRRWLNRVNVGRIYQVLKDRGDGGYGL